MTKTTTNILGIIVVILAGIYFYVSYCSSCAGGEETAALMIRNNTGLLVPYLEAPEMQVKQCILRDLESELIIVSPFNLKNTSYGS